MLAPCELTFSQVFCLASLQSILQPLGADALECFEVGQQTEDSYKQNVLGQWRNFWYLIIWDWEESVKSLIDPNRLAKESRKVAEQGHWHKTSPKSEIAISSTWPELLSHYRFPLSQLICTPLVWNWLAKKMSKRSFQDFTLQIFYQTLQLKTVITNVALSSTLDQFGITDSSWKDNPKFISSTEVRCQVQH